MNKRPIFPLNEHHHFVACVDAATVFYTANILHIQISHFVETEVFMFLKNMLNQQTAPCVRFFIDKKVELTVVYFATMTVSSTRKLLTHTHILRA